MSVLRRGKKGSGGRKKVPAGEKKPVYSPRAILNRSYLEILESWECRNIDELTKHWGEPSSVWACPGECGWWTGFPKYVSKVYRWTVTGPQEPRKMVFNAKINAYIDETPEPLECRTEFGVDDKGVIIWLSSSSPYECTNLMIKDQWSPQTAPCR